jgi:hypothetical protein
MADEKDEQPDVPDDASEETVEPEWQRRRRLAAVFGDVLPETTSDDRDPDTAEDEAAGERWLRAQVPPHHG